MSFRVKICLDGGRWKLRIQPQVNFEDRIKAWDAPAVKRRTHRKKFAHVDIKGNRQYLVVAPPGFPGVQYRRCPSWHVRARCDKGPRNGSIIKMADRKYVQGSWWIMTVTEQWLPEKFLILITI
jgi:hypothetical protein